MIKAYLRKFYYSLTPEHRLRLRKLAHLPVDTLNQVMGGEKGCIPKKGDIYVGSGDFIAQGQSHLKLLTTYTPLRPTDRVLDIGCGIGRTAVALRSYLNSSGAYSGFDVVKKGIDWCKQHISAAHPNFDFLYVPLFNDLYNSSTGRASTFTFPYPADEFDIAFLFSVFTHLQPDEIDKYLGQINRVLKPGGTCLATCFVYDDATEITIANQGEFSFPVHRGGYRLMNSKVKSANIALSETLLYEMIAKNGLLLSRTIAGYWVQTREKGPDAFFQDIVIPTKG